MEEWGIIALAQGIFVVDVLFFFPPSPNMDVLAVFFPSCLLIPELGLDNSEKKKKNFQRENSLPCWPPLGMAQGFSLGIWGFWDLRDLIPGLGPLSEPLIQGIVIPGKPEVPAGSDPKFQPGAGLGNDKSRISPDPHRALARLTSAEKPQARRAGKSRRRLLAADRLLSL